MIVFVSDTPALLEMVKASEQRKVLQAIECSWFLRTALEIPTCRICPRYFRLRANNLLEQCKGKLQITDIKTLFNCAMMTLDMQAHQTELKQQQLSFLHAADQETGSKDPGKSVQRAYPTRSQTLNSYEGRFLTDWSTELDCKVITVAETAKKGKGLFAICYIRSGDFGC
eukprot:2293039-Rhodomonas_salina.1